MKFKVDENLPQEITDLLIVSGFEAHSVRDERLSGKSDEILSAICKDEERAFITLDTDFLDIRRFPPEHFFGIVVMRLVSQDKDHVIKIFEENLLHFFHEPLDK